MVGKSDERVEVDYKAPASKRLGLTYRRNRLANDFCKSFLSGISQSLRLDPEAPRHLPGRAEGSALQRAA